MNQVTQMTELHAAGRTSPAIKTFAPLALEGVDAAAVSDRRPVALIPAYKPDVVLVDIARRLDESGQFRAVLVVDDGSGPDFRNIFQRLAVMGGVNVIAHCVNLGKGAALKSGFNWIGLNAAESCGVVTLDADGQHAVDDVLRVAETLSGSPKSLVLGCREFPTDIPLRSRFGNLVTRWVMRGIGGLKVSDTQTGLRGIPASVLPHLLRLRTTGYDFELDMLLGTRQWGVNVVEVPIRTIYIDGNRGSHFDPIRDSLRIYYVFLRFNLSSLSAFAVDYSLFMMLHIMGISAFVSQFGARAVSSVFNYQLNRTLVFKSSERGARSLLYYYVTAIFVAACSYGLIVAMHSGFGMPVYLGKLLADSGLYVASFAIQREFVFRRRAGGDDA